MKALCILSALVCSLLLFSCKPAMEDKEKMHANAKRMSDSIEKAIDDALNSVSITPQPAPAAPADTAKK